MKYFRGLIISALLIGGCLTTECVSRRRANPTGRVASLSESLAWQPSAEQFAAVDVNGQQHVIAYGSRSSWPALSSGPSAYLFNEAGRLVDWSFDIGDDPQFDQQWSAQRSCGKGHMLARSDVQQLEATSPGG